MKKLEFRYVTRNRKSILLDREDLITWRQSYLVDIKKFREEGKQIYYLDETWVNEGHTPKKCWRDETIKSAKQAFLSGLSTGLTSPTGKGKRLIILHIGSEKGFVDGGALVFESCKSSDYHEEMNSDKFNEWFSQVMDVLEPGSVIVLDNASYHSVKIESIPTNQSNKASIKNWLDSKGILYKDDDLKKDLLARVQEVRWKFDKYVVDEMAKERGFTVLRLPPYHAELNPIELIWADIKSYVGRFNKTFKLAELKNLLQEAMCQITPDKWKKCVEHVKNKVEPEMRALDGILDLPHIEPVIITFDSDDDDDDDHESHD